VRHWLILFTESASIFRWLNVVLSEKV